VVGGGKLRLSPEKMRIVRVPDRKLGWWAIWVGIGVVEREGIGTGVREREGGPRSLWLFSLFSSKGGMEVDGETVKKDGRQRGARGGGGELEGFSW
jgi:hypothetical protein